MGIQIPLPSAVPDSDARPDACRGPGSTGPFGGGAPGALRLTGGGSLDAVCAATGGATVAISATASPASVDRSITESCASERDRNGHGAAAPAACSSVARPRQDFACGGLIEGDYRRWPLGDSPDERLPRDRDSSGPFRTVLRGSPRVDSALRGPDFCSIWG